MKFKVNVDQFMRSITPAANIALKNVKKDDRKEPFRYAGMLTIEASPDVLRVKAYGGTASIIARVDKADSYVPDVTGVVTVRASEVMNSLKSFLPTDNLIVSAQSQQMTLALVSDQEIFVGFPTLPDLIECPPMPNEIEQESLVDRTCFVKGMQAVEYAMAEGEKMFSYMCILFESWKNKMRFTAGSGGRFASFNIDSDSQQISENETAILFPRTNVSNIIKIFKDANYPTIKVKTAECDPRNNVPEQIVLENDSIALALYGTEPLTKYPDLSSIFDYDYSYRISTHMRDWKRVVEAISATFHFHDRNIHNTRVTADLLHGHFNIRTNTKMQINKKVDFAIGTHVTDSAKDKTYQPWFCCNSEYLLEMVKKGYKNEIMTLHFDDQAKLAEIPEDKPKQMKPVLITFPEKANKDDTKEKYSVFFTVSTK